MLKALIAFAIVGISGFSSAARAQDVSYRGMGGCPSAQEIQELLNRTERISPAQVMGPFDVWRANRNIDAFVSSTDSLRRELESINTSLSAPSGRCYNEATNEAITAALRDVRGLIEILSIPLRK